MKLELSMPIAPMEAKQVATIPLGEGWQYEPKWDGFRCVVFRDGKSAELQSKAGQPLTRYFPELVAVFAAMDASRFVLDGEIVVPQGKKLSFDALLQRIHPAASRVRKLAEATPALFIAFDLLAGTDGKSIMQQPLQERRHKLEKFAGRNFKGSSLKLCPATSDSATAARWFKGVGGVLDGIMAKHLELPYRAGLRDGMVKIKRIRTADCVVGGFRYAGQGGVVGSLLLGLYDEAGLLNHVGFSSGFKADERAELTRRLEKLVKPPGFTGARPGGPSRWSAERNTEWCPLDPKLVVEVSYDHFSGGRFRHGTRVLRWRPDKAAKQCTCKQVQSETHLVSLDIFD